MATVTYNFRNDAYVYTDRQKQRMLQGEWIDARNGIKCIDPTMDMECYMNYIDYLNTHRLSWRSNGYLDLGLMPLAVGPSFFQDILQEGLQELISKHPLKYYILPAATFMYDKCAWRGNDIWMLKREVAEYTGISESSLNLEKFLRWCGLL